MSLSYSLNSIKADFGLSSFRQVYGVYLAGMAVGGIFGGWACDKFGRVRIVVISILTFSLLTCGLGFTQSFLEFGLLRFFASLGLGSLYIACNTLMAEYVPTRYRTTVLVSYKQVGRLAILLQRYSLDGLFQIKWLAYAVLCCHCTGVDCCFNASFGTRTTRMATVSFTTTNT